MSTLRPLEASVSRSKAGGAGTLALDNKRALESPTSRAEWLRAYLPFWWGTMEFSLSGFPGGGQRGVWNCNSAYVTQLWAMIGENER